MISQRNEREEEEEEDIFEGEEGRSAAAKRIPSGREPGKGASAGNSPAAMRRLFAARISESIEPKAVPSGF